MIIAIRMNVRMRNWLQVEESICTGLGGPRRTGERWLVKVNEWMINLLNNSIYKTGSLLDVGKHNRLEHLMPCLHIYLLGIVRSSESKYREQFSISKIPLYWMSSYTHQSNLDRKDHTRGIRYRSGFDKGNHQRYPIMKVKLFEPFHGAVHEIIPP